MTRVGAVWLDRDLGRPDGWDVRDAHVAGVDIGLPAGWPDPSTAEEGPALVARSPGPLPGEGLTIARMGTASPEHELTGWLELPMAMVGGLDPQTLAADGDTEVLEWARAPADGLAAALSVDEAAAFSGLAKYLAGDARPELVRSYVVLARRANTAWKIGLALSSACLPGASDEVVDANDHVRARAVFGQLRFA